MPKKELPSFANANTGINVQALKDEIRLLKRDAIQEIPISMIDIHSNIRSKYDEQSISELADSIADKGQIQPIGLRPSGVRFHITFGHRRFLACEKLKKDTIRAIVREGDEKADDFEILSLQLLENIQREDLSPEDMENAVTVLIERLGSINAVAEYLHKSPAWVSRYATAANVREDLSKGGVDVSAVGSRALAEFNSLSGDEKENTLEEVKNGGKSLTGSVRKKKEAKKDEKIKATSGTVYFSEDKKTFRFRGSVSEEIRQQLLQFFVSRSFTEIN